MDREIAPEIRRSLLVRRVVTVVAAVAAIIFSVGAILQWLRPSVRERDLQFATVDRGLIDSTLQAAGTIVPEAEQVVSSPVEARVLRIVRRPGDRVRAGDELIALDTGVARLEVGRLHEQIAQKESDFARLRLRLEDNMATLRSNLQQRQLDAEIVRFKAEQTSRLHREGLATKQDDLAAATAAKKSELEIGLARESIQRAQRSGEAETASMTAELRILHQQAEESKRQLEMAMMRADRDGVITWMVGEAGATVRRGDIVARIADLSAFRADASISDLHASKLAAGMRVRVRVDDTTTIAGQITSVEPRVENGTVKFRVALDDHTNTKLRNNLRVDIFAITGTRSGALRVRRGALGQSNREDIFVRRGEKLEAVKVTWGLMGDELIEPVSGLRQGDIVVISNMTDYEGVKELKLK
jgi:HlyD family secretion protein